MRAFNPAGKVPVLVVDGEPITDSTAILHYLADRHRALTYPAGTLDRARQDSLTQFLLDEFDAALWVAARHSFILPEELRMPAIKILAALGVRAQPEGAGGPAWARGRS